MEERDLKIVEQYGDTDPEEKETVLFKGDRRYQGRAANE